MNTSSKTKLCFTPPEQVWGMFKDIKWKQNGRSLLLLLLLLLSIHLKTPQKRENDLEGTASSGALKQGALPDMLAVL